MTNIFYNGFHKFLFAGLALVLVVICWGDLKARISWQAVDAKIVSFSETCTVRNAILTDCTEAARTAFAERKPLERNIKYVLSWTDSEGKPRSFTLDRQTAIRAFFKAGPDETVRLFLDPKTAEPKPIKPVSFLALSLSAAALIVWFCFLPINKMSLWGWTSPPSLSKSAKLYDILGLAQTSWRIAFGCMWLAAFGCFGLTYDRKVESQYISTDAVVEAVQYRCVIKWQSWFFIRPRTKETRAMSCKRAEEYRQQIGKISARVVPSNLYLVSYDHPLREERAAILGDRYFPKTMPLVDQTVSLLIHPQSLNDFETPQANQKSNRVNNWLFYGGLAAALLLAALALWLHRSTRYINYRLSRKTR